MSTRYVRTTRRAGAAALLAAALTFTLAACGGEDGTGGKDKASSSSSGAGKDQPSKGSDGKTYPDTSKVLATFKGEKGIEMVIHEAKRDSGGFLTVTGEVKNGGSDGYTTPVQWSGMESDVAGAGPSFAAMTLTDSKEKKRYYVLRDTDNRPLTTSNYTSFIKAGESLPFFAQFPAPPTSTTQVGVTFTGFATGTIEIS
ncbi:hypothetical protein AB0C77_05355 [Streptomyces sp. NPDC048629]|uniref:hypothetical protein n=1 Tax=Streptomyces sp. NPDC048629 TaxID=3154824 RepID=UPI003437A8E5